MSVKTNLSFHTVESAIDTSSESYHVTGVTPVISVKLDKMSCVI